MVGFSLEEAVNGRAEEALLLLGSFLQGSREVMVSHGAMWSAVVLMPPCIASGDNVLLDPNAFGRQTRQWVFHGVSSRAICLISPVIERQSSCVLSAGT